MASTESAKKKEIEIRSENCSGCSYCQLACSFAKTGAFGLKDSRIRMRRIDGKERYLLSFLESCDRCGFCAGYCFFGALTKVESCGEGEAK
jgi:ferredoxin